MRILLIALIIIFFAIGVWKSIELEKSQKSVKMLESELMISEHYLVDDLKILSLIYYDFINNKSSIKEITENITSVLIYRFSKNMCPSCIHEDLMEVDHLQQEIGKERVLLLPTYPDNRTGRLEVSNLLAKFNYVNITADLLRMPTLEGDFLQRYFGVIDKEGNLTMVFFPRRGNPNLTRLYFSEVKKVILD